MNNSRIGFLNFAGEWTVGGRFIGWEHAPQEVHDVDAQVILKLFRFHTQLGDLFFPCAAQVRAGRVAKVTVEDTDVGLDHQQTAHLVNFFFAKDVAQFFQHFLDLAAAQSLDSFAFPLGDANGTIKRFLKVLLFFPEALADQHCNNESAADADTNGNQQQLCALQGIDQVVEDQMQDDGYGNPAERRYKAACMLAPAQAPKRNTDHRAGCRVHQRTGQHST